ncbi:hopanoid biosynthesis associated radical SAM protein HpnH [Rhodoblastus acidophilus]|uniref:adenosyl-hopene transferase HpnH n=1 Tax=Rhodoblastus acidophilus TaxID=1074 RepID=UPI002225B30C|nr:adenosyl-hopene transferase HpnH [Rhodoblastus acidophilus]MCW2286134.1 hopanoid biosynthesis associated radical SAM protein HpnH [Rhodoblastus acidophilus]MCW2335028.1 hopanoid biosynthesis associated radical SAM protein HpnH [Rhodoblastus acidophilus]
MGIPVLEGARIGAYIVKQHLLGRKRYPLVLMLEPLFRCNLACSGCGKIDYPDKILNQRLPYEDCMEAIDECGAPVVVIAGGEPLLHKDLPRIVRGALDRKKFVTVCTNALLLEKRLGEFEPSSAFNWSVHLDGDREMHDKSVCQDGVYDRAVKAIAAARARGFKVSINCTLFNDADPERVANFLDTLKGLGVNGGATVAPGYAYERAPNQQHFLNRAKTKELFRAIFRRGNGGKKWDFFQSSVFLDFLAGNQTFECTPWGNPARTVFGWQRPCYLLNEGYASTFKELMETTDWDAYGVGNYEKCADCMVHCGFEPSAVKHAITHPWDAIRTALFGVATEGPMKPEIPLDKQRPAQFIFAAQVEEQLNAVVEAEKRAKQQAEEAKQAAEAAE